MTAWRDGHPRPSAMPVVGLTTSRKLSQGSKTAATSRGTHWTANKAQAYAPDINGSSPTQRVDMPYASRPEVKPANSARPSQRGNRVKGRETRTAGNG